MIKMQDILSESKTSNMMKAIRKHGTAGPWDIIVSKNNKIVKRVSVQNLKEIPAEMDDVRKKFPNHKIGIEAKSGRIAYRESFDFEQMKVYSDPYAKSFVKEAEEPEHFGGGENIDILGFKTKHFDICKSAVILYNKLKEADLNDDGKELVISSAKELDHLFEMEKQVVKGEEVDHDPVEHGVEIVNIISFQLGRVAEIINDDFERDTNFLKLHLMEIINRR